MSDWLDINRKLWDGRVPVHVKSDFFDAGKFLEGGTSLTKIEPGALGSEVAGKKCSISNAILGLDTLSWARLGARVTGADFSPKAIQQARQLARQTGQKARFVESDIDSLRLRK